MQNSSALSSVRELFDSGYLRPLRLSLALFGQVLSGFVERSRKPLTAKDAENIREVRKEDQIGQFGLDRPPWLCGAFRSRFEVADISALSR
jgi:hypothetical protein